MFCISEEYYQVKQRKSWSLKKKDKRDLSNIQMLHIEAGYLGQVATLKSSVIMAVIIKPNADC